MWQALLRKLPRQVRQFARFHRDGITGRESLDKQLLVVGVGRIGHEIAVLGRALGMHVQGVDIEQKHDDIAYTTFEQGREHADIIVCAMNLTDQNRGYFNVRSLSLCRRGALFVNVARGEMSPPSQLLHLLREDRLGGIGLDVFAREKEIAVAFRSGTYLQDPESDALRELMKSDRVILTPHNAFNTREAVERKASQSIEQIQHFLQQKAFKWSVPT
jgi:D-lactate dehydrogenase